MCAKTAFHASDSGTRASQEQATSGEVVLGLASTTGFDRVVLHAQDHAPAESASPQLPSARLEMDEPSPDAADEAGPGNANRS